MADINLTPEKFAEMVYDLGLVCDDVNLQKREQKLRDWVVANDSDAHPELLGHLMGKAFDGMLNIYFPDEMGNTCVYKVALEPLPIGVLVSFVHTSFAIAANAEKATFDAAVIGGGNRKYDRVKCMVRGAIPLR